MKQFDYTEKWKKLLTPEIVSYLTTIHEYKGKQYLIAERHADVLENLVEMAKIQSTESSNKNVAGNLKLCDNLKLRKLGYRRINFLSHRYFMLYRIENDTVYVDNIFHELQDYENKMN